MSILKIYPPIGVARVGNSSDFFVGPEIPGVPANWDATRRKFKAFKDSAGKILRQAARFRIFEFDAAGNVLKEVTLEDGVRIEWRIHVANRKASFFSFNGQSGARTDATPPYTKRSERPDDAVEKPEKGRGQPERKNRRNASIADRHNLEIDPGEIAISTPGSIDLIDSKTQAPIHFLGQARMEPEGRLLFLGAFGSANFLGDPRAIDEYANNDGWFDDVCDGVIRATVTFPNGRKETAESAWVVVGPPDFAPGIGNVVTLYDTLWDLGIRAGLPCQPGADAGLQDFVSQQKAWNAQKNEFGIEYEPSFTSHIYPLLSRALAARDVHETSRKSYHDTLADWTRLASRAENNIRLSVFKKVRNPNSLELDRNGMPKGLGDDFNTLDDFEEDPSKPQPSARAFLSLTRVQYALLKAWSEGRFKEDWVFGDVKYAPVPDLGPATPHGLTIAALDNAVGGPFFPGIEVSWLVRETELYASAFRFKEPGFTIGPLTFQPGFFSQQMALPWHADFYDCHKEDHTPEGADEPAIYMWWTAQRPDDIRADPSGPYRRWVSEFDAANNGDDPDDADNITNLARFEQMRTRWSELSFVVLDGDEHIEQVASESSGAQK